MRCYTSISDGVIFIMRYIQIHTGCAQQWDVHVQLRSPYLPGEPDHLGRDGSAHHWLLQPGRHHPQPGACRDWDCDLLMVSGAFQLAKEHSSLPSFRWAHYTQSSLSILWLSHHLIRIKDICLVHELAITQPSDQFQSRINISIYRYLWSLFNFIIFSPVLI